MKAIFKFLGAPFRNFKSIGFTNRFGLYLIGLLVIGLVGGFYLALKSIVYQYTGALMCWTVVFTPIGTACSIVLGKIVDKSVIENTSADGDGIKYAAARANGFRPADYGEYNQEPTHEPNHESPPI